jgi:hypothetical protein
MNKIRKPHELNVVTTLKSLIYGQPGLGKTTFALSAPNPVLLDFDNGVHRVNSMHQTDTLQIESWDDVLKELADGTFNSYGTLVIDTAGKMLDYLSAYIIRKNPKMGKSNGALTLQGYGERKSEFSAFIKKISIMGKHIIFVAHEKEEKDGDVNYKRPEVGGSSGNDLYKELDLIGYMEAIGKKRTISFLPQEKYYAKNACGLNETIELPELTANVPNNFFTTHIVDAYKSSLESRKTKIGEYNDLMDVIYTKIDSITEAAIANEVIDWAVNYKEHIWGSKVIASQKINEKAKEIGLKFNPKTKKYEDAKQPANV